MHADEPVGGAPGGPTFERTPARIGVLAAGLPARVDEGRRIAAAAAVLAAIAAGLTLVGGPTALLFDNLQELLAAGGGALAVAVASRRSGGQTRLVQLVLAVALAGAFLGMLAWDASHSFGSWLMTIGDLLFVGSAVIGVVAVVWAIWRGLPADRLLGVGIDTLIVFLAGTVVVAALWDASIVAPGDQTASFGAAIMVATSAGCAFGLVARRIGWSTSGPWITLAGATVVGASWLLWLGGLASPATVDVSDFLFSAGILAIGYGGATWQETPSDDAAFERLAAVFDSLLPVGAIVGSITLLAVTKVDLVGNLLGVSAVAVIGTSAVRQLHLYSREARAKAAQSAATRRLAETVSTLELEIAERRRLEAERETVQERLLVSQRLESIGRLAGGVAHDFNNLLTAIRGHADLAGHHIPADDPGRADLDAIRYAADQAASLTRRLLAFSRNQELRPTVVDLGEIVAGAEPLLRRLLGEPIALEVNVPTDLWPVRVDPGQLESVIVNLAINARDAMESGGRLTIEAANVELDDAYARAHPEVAPGEYAMVAVSDTGVGMDAPTLARAFEPFFTTKEPGKGTGLGLSMVYGTVRQSDGHVFAYSEPGHGTTFRIYLPRTEADPAAGPGTVPSAPLPARPRGETILVAEDEEAVRDMIVAALRRNGHTVLAVGSGEEALEVLERDDGVRVLLTDVVMRGMTGLELVERARAFRPEVRAVCMSGYTPLRLKTEASNDVTFIAKPFTLSALAEVIGRVLDD
jgi:signal transduction histidine kinase/CheY-like chemotaxis protein